MHWQGHLGRPALRLGQKYRGKVSACLCEIDGALGEAATGHNDTKAGVGMVYHAIKVSNNVRANTRDVSLTLNDSLETVFCYFDVDASVA
jgi:hypothetical protein